jgi:glycerol-3-phosphate dehydrogenase
LFQQYEDHLTLSRDLPREVARHLVHTHGTTSLRVVDLGDSNKAKGLLGVNERIHPDYPFLKSEIAYGAVHEMAQKPNDILCRRVPIAFLNRQAAEDVLPEVVAILGKEHKWST